MLHTLANLVDQVLGLHEAAKDLTFLHMTARGFVVFVFAIVLARYADRRFMSRSACFDFMLAVILGSVLSRGINGQAKFFPTLGVSALLVVLHQAVGMLAYHSHWFSKLVKGQPICLMRDGRADVHQLRRNHITEDDLDENLRLNGNVASRDEVAEARLERNGNVSVIKKGR